MIRTPSNQTMKSRTANPRNLRKLAELIRAEILRDIEDPRLRELGAKIIGLYNVPSRDPVALARAFQLYSQEHIKYFRERPEYVVAPWVTARWAIGDCDDKSRLIGALLACYRIPARLAYVSFRDPSGTKAHVWPEFRESNNDAWKALESVRDWPLGKSPLEMLAAKKYPYQVFYVEI
jgi:transglutaminase-like putative cysteine protease